MGGGERKALLTTNPPRFLKGTAFIASTEALDARWPSPFPARNPWPRRFPRRTGLQRTAARSPRAVDPVDRPAPHVNSRAAPPDRRRRPGLLDVPQASVVGQVHVVARRPRARSMGSGLAIKQIPN